MGLPPPTLDGATPILVGSSSTDTWLNDSAIFANGNGPPTDGNNFAVEVDARARLGEFPRFPDCRIRTYCRLRGASLGKGFPAPIRESATVHAPEFALRRNSQPGGPLDIAKYFVARAGDLPVYDRRIGWFIPGCWHLQSAAGSTVACRFCELAKDPKLPLICYIFEDNRLPEPHTKGHLDVG